MANTKRFGFCRTRSSLSRQMLNASRRHPKLEEYARNQLDQAREIRILVEEATVVFAERTFTVPIHRVTSPSGKVHFSAEITFGNDDHVIRDASSAEEAKALLIYDAAGMLQSRTPRRPDSVQ